MDQINNTKKTVIAFQKLMKLSDKKDLLNAHDKVYLEISFKRMPLNHDPFCEVLGPLPAGTNNLQDLSVCLIVRDVNRSKNRVKDRQLDLQMTRDHYRNLLEQAELDEQVLRSITILPVRELITEYNSYQAKNRLAASFDVFLVDATLVNNKYKFLRQFLGTSFTDRSKKVPIPISFGPEKLPELKTLIEQAVRCTNFYVTSYMQTSSILIGRTSFDAAELATNLKFAVNQLRKKYDSLICTLKLVDEKLNGIIFFADLRRQTTKSFAELFPLKKKQKRQRVQIDNQFKGINVDEEMSDTELETEDGRYEIKAKKLRYEDVSIF